MSNGRDNSFRKLNKDKRRSLRLNMTPAETALWKALKGRQLLGKKFRRQHSIGPWIVDFCCPEERLIIELDGEVHNSPQNRDYDAQRQDDLSEQMYTVLRFENRQVFEDFDNVLAAIARHLEKNHGEVL